jgi:IclR family transcriptional regulator, acetate operon repressor
VAQEQIERELAIQNKHVVRGRRETGAADERSEQSMPSEPRYPIDSVDKALKLLLMLRDHPAIGVSEAGRHLAVARSTAHRLLAMLAHHGFVQQIPDTKAYTAGPALVEVGLAALREADIRVTARPFIDELVRELDETVHLVMLRGTQLLYVDCVEGSRALRAGSRIGTLLPAHCTAGGKALLAEIPAERVRELYPEERLEQLTPRSIGTLTRLLAELDETRRHGYALNDGESERELRAVAVAIKDANGHARAGITLAAPEYRLSPEVVPGVAAAMRRAAARIAEAVQ